jgi:hypothetical protein
MRTEKKRLTGTEFSEGWHPMNFLLGLTVGFLGFGCKGGFLSHQHKTSFGM